MVSLWFRVSPPLAILSAVVLFLFLGGCGSCGDPAEPVDDAAVAMDVADGTDSEMDGADGADGADAGDAADTAAPFRCGMEPLARTIPASEWVRQTTDIQSYSYEADESTDRIDLVLLSGDGEELGTLGIRGFFESSRLPGSQVEATFERQGASPIEVTSQARPTGVEDFRVDTVLERDGEAMSVHARFSPLACYHGEKPEEGASHPCAWPLPVSEPAFAVPSCGFDVAPNLQASPNLARLEYRRGVEGRPEDGGLRWTGELQATIDAYDNGETTDAKTVSDWAAETGADAILGTASETLLTAAYSDPAWIDSVEQHLVRCAGVDRTTEQPLFGCGPVDGLESIGDLTTRRQGQGGSCRSSQASSKGDPHLTTYDGTGYSVQSAGEFILAEAQRGEPFVIQVRAEPTQSCHTPSIPACEDVSVNTAVATQVGGVRVAMYRDRMNPIWINGKPVDDLSKLNLDSMLPEGAEIEISVRLEVRWPSGARLTAKRGTGGLQITGALPVSRRGQVAGLWGLFNGDPADDYVTRDGQRLDKPLDFTTKYETFAESWRITADESLFDYQMGKGTESFVIEDYPSAPVTLEDLPEDVRREARKECSDVEEEPQLRWCILDVACLCDAGASEPHEETPPVEDHNETSDEPVVTHGDVCLRTPESLAYSRADQADPNTCTEPPDPCVELFREKEDVTLSSAVSVDATQAGEFDAAEDLQSAEVSATTEVDSFMLHLNEVPGGSGILTGGVTFSHPIAGVIVQPQSLKDSDGELGNDDKAYPDGRGDRGVDWMEDAFEISEDGKRLDVQLFSESGLDEIRVLTEQP